MSSGSILLCSARIGAGLRGSGTRGVGTGFMTGTCGIATGIPVRGAAGGATGIDTGALRFFLGRFPAVGFFACLSSLLSSLSESDISKLLKYLIKKKAIFQSPQQSLKALKN